MNITRTLVTTFVALGVLLSSGCAVISQNEVGVKRTNGKLSDETLGPGLYFLGPMTRMMRLPINVENLEVELDLPSQEGLTVGSEISILYRIDPNFAHKVLSQAGEDFEQSLILSTFRSAAADVCSRFMAKDMHSGARATIERQIQKRMTDLLGERGFIIESVLLKSINLPPGLQQSIEQRLSAEQDAMRMQFILDQEKAEAERKMIEAKGIRDAQKVLAEGLTHQILRLRTIEAFERLAESPNSKVIITDGDTPLMNVNEQGEVEQILKPNQQ
jgi:regulator of protease activity HflC (stomatin/prohibitin superfamily)